MTEPTAPHPDAAAWTVTVDGVPGVPFLLVEALGGAPPYPWRLPRYGRVEACGLVDYGAYGPLLTLLCEGGAVVWRPQAAPGQQIGMVPWRDTARVAAALGVV